GNATADDFLAALAAEAGPDAARGTFGKAAAPPGTLGNAVAPNTPDTRAGGERSELATAFRTFLDQGGIPLVTATLSCPAPGGGGSPAVKLSQKRYLPSGSKGSTDELWKIPVC